MGDVGGLVVVLLGFAVYNYHVVQTLRAAQQDVGIVYDGDDGGRSEVAGGLAGEEAPRTRSLGVGGDVVEKSVNSDYLEAAPRKSR